VLSKAFTSIKYTTLLAMLRLHLVSRKSHKMPQLHVYIHIIRLHILDDYIPLNMLPSNTISHMIQSNYF